jgi:hypothetical protein
MRLYTVHITEHRRYHRKSTERANHRPKRPEDITDILSLRPSVPQEPRYRSG